MPDALIAGLPGPQPDARLLAAVTHVGRALRAGLQATWQVPHPQLCPEVDGATLESAARQAVRWLVLVGEMRRDPDLGDLQLCTAGGQTFDVERLRKLLKSKPAVGRVLVWDVPADFADELLALDFGPCAVKAFGPGLTDRLVQALLPAAPGEVTAGAVAAALGGHSDDPSRVLVAARALLDHPTTCWP